MLAEIKVEKKSSKQMHNIGVCLLSCFLCLFSQKQKKMFPVFVFTFNKHKRM